MGAGWAGRGSEVILFGIIKTCETAALEASLLPCGTFCSLPESYSGSPKVFSLIFARSEWR